MGNELLENLDRLHTTELGVIRIKKNLSLNVENVIEWCKEKISLSYAEITRKGKNWYITIDNCIKKRIFRLVHSFGESLTVKNFWKC